MPLGRLEKLVNDIHLEHGKLQGHLDKLLFSIQRLQSSLENLKKCVGEPDLGLRRENEALREALKPVVDVKFKKTGGRAATWFQEAKVKGKPSIRVFVKDYENASAAIDAVDTAQKRYAKLTGETQ